MSTSIHPRTLTRNPLLRNRGLKNVGDFYGRASEAWGVYFSGKKRIPKMLEGARAQGAAIMTRTWRIGPDALEVISMPIAAGQKRRQWLHQTRRRGRHKHLPNLIGPTSTQASKGHGWCRLPLFRTPPRERFVALLRRQIMPRESSD